MGSADFSQFVVTTADETACETSTLKVRALSPHPPATFTGTSSNFWASSLLADLPVFPSLVCGSYSSGQGFAYSFLQIPPHDGHPCCSAMYFVVAYAYSGLTPVRARPWRANQKNGSGLRLVSSEPFVISLEPRSGFRRGFYSVFRPRSAGPRSRIFVFSGAGTVPRDSLNYSYSTSYRFY